MIMNAWWIQDDGDGIHDNKFTDGNGKRVQSLMR